jgi:hypothetical protein
MFDGGGAGTSGDVFKGGGAISALANALKIRPYGSTAPRANIGYRNIGDMFDGGGPQRSGGDFVGLPHSQFLNLFGLRPRGGAPTAVPTAVPTTVPTAEDAGLTDVNVGGTGAPLVADTGGTPVSVPPIEMTTLPATFPSGQTYEDFLRQSLSSWPSSVHMPMNTEHYDMMARRFGNLSRTFSPSAIMKVGRSHYNTGGF